jgi:hypothetical protein
VTTVDSTTLVKQKVVEGQYDKKKHYVEEKNVSGGE